MTRVREERPGDEAGIAAVVSGAFDGAPHAGGNEAAIVEALRRDGDLALSLVAESDGRIAGHAAFSPVAVGTAKGVFALGPLSVRPECQRFGIGARLVRHGLDRLRQRGAAACVLVGDPAYYARFGFEPGGLAYRDVPPGYVLGAALTGDVPRGEIAYPRAFDAG